MVPAKTWRVHVGMARTEGQKLRRQLAAAAGKKGHDLSILFHGVLWCWGGGRSLYPGHPVLGRRGTGWKMAS